MKKLSKFPISRTAPTIITDKNGSRFHLCEATRKLLDMEMLALEKNIITARYGYPDIRSYLEHINYHGCSDDSVMDELELMGFHQLSTKAGFYYLKKIHLQRGMNEENYKN